MNRCRHTCWLKIWGRGPESGLEITDQPQRLLEDFDNPDADTAGVLVLIGNQSKQAAFRKLAFQNEQVRARANGEVHLSTASFRDCRQRSFVIADTDIPRHHSKPSPSRRHLCHEVTTHTFIEDPMPGEMSDLFDHLLHKALFPFADVVCVFVEDIGGFQASLRRLLAWMKKGPLSKSPIKPRILFVVNQEDKKRSQTELERCLQARCLSLLHESFHSISIVGVPKLSSKGKRKRCKLTRRWKVLETEILRVLELSRQSRRRSKYLFSINHLVEFLHHGAIAARNPSSEPFDFIKTSRLHRDVAPDLSHHLSNFMEKFDSLSTFRRFCIPLISSSFLLDHYPPGMHLFDPRHVFQELYEDACSRASSEFKSSYKGSIKPSEITRLISCSMFTQFAQLQAFGASLDWHKHQLMRTRTILAQVRSNGTCLSCIRRRPQYEFQCGHLLCQNCVRTFYCRDDLDRWEFQPKACHVCNAPTPGLCIRIVPDTCLIRVLSIDGGGIRGSAPIGFLMAIQDAIGIPHYKVQRNFDVKFGTSSGGLSVISLDILGWSVEDCMSHLEHFASQAFGSRWSSSLQALSRIPIISSVVRVLGFVYALLIDRKYSADGLEKLLLDTYGHDRSITATSAAVEMGAHVGVTLTKARDGSAMVATNYNGVGKRPENPMDYSHLLSGEGEQQAKWWEVLRCGTAAPYYFKSKQIGGYGALQDGGLAFNNPASVAMREATALSPDGAEPSLLVSLGTGSSNCEDEPRNVLLNKFPFRVLTALWRQASSKVAWEQLEGHHKVDSRTKLFRFDVEFEENQPLLDEVDKMDQIRLAAYQTIKDSTALLRLCRHLRAELFFFELDESFPPRFFNGVYQGVGYISCRLRALTPSYEAFMQQLRQQAASFHLGGRSLGFPCQNPHESFSKRVCFSLPSIEEPFTIKLAEGDGDSFDISGSAFTLKWLLRRQSLDAKFGTSDHRKRKALCDPTILQAKRRRSGGDYKALHRSCKNWKK